MLGKCEIRTFLNFTFHNVSINTVIVDTKLKDIRFFTFHNVSINTEQGQFVIYVSPSLHSTMFLLIR